MRSIWMVLAPIVLLVFVTVAVGVPPAQARLMQETLASGEELYKSLRSLQDNHGYSWQLIAFKTASADRAYLRLVGFPSVPPINHQAPLLVQPRSFAASLHPVAVPDQTPQFGQGSPPATVAQYALGAILEAGAKTKANPEPKPARITLIVPAQSHQGDSSSDLHIPKSVVVEWWAILGCEAAVCRFDPV